MQEKPYKKPYEVEIILVNKDHLDPNLIEMKTEIFIDLFLKNMLKYFQVIIINKLLRKVTKKGNKNERFNNKNFKRI